MYNIQLYQGVYFPSSRFREQISSYGLKVKYFNRFLNIKNMYICEGRREGGLRDKKIVFLKKSLSIFAVFYIFPFKTSTMTFTK